MTKTQIFGATLFLISPTSGAQAHHKGDLIAVDLAGRAGEPSVIMHHEHSPFIRPLPEFDFNLATCSDSAAIQFGACIRPMSEGQ